jgi:glycosyltransferase involved in cell wall biosynthesis
MARIALVHDIAGVAEVQAELLRKAGHEVDQIALPTTGASWTWPAKALAIPVRIAAFLPIAQRLRRARYDVVHIHYLSQGVVGVLARVSFFAQAHGSDLHTNLQNPLYRPVTSLVAKRAKAIFYVTPNLPAFLDGFQSKVVYLPNPVELPAAPAPTHVERILIFTRLHTIKGVERIFPAVERLSSIAHVTALEYGPLARDYITRYGKQVEFVKPIAHEQVGAFLGNVDLVIGQMRQGVLGLMEIEALAVGRPVIAAVDSNLYREDPPPVVVATGPDEIVAAVERLKNDPAELARLSAEGRAWALRNHGYAHHLELLESTYFGSKGGGHRG